MKLTYKHTQKACCLAYVTGAIVNNFAALLYLMFQKSFGITLFQIGFLMGLNFGIQIFVDLLGAKYAQQLGYRCCAVGAFVFAFLGLVMLPLLTAFMQNKFAAIVISISFSAIGSGMLEVIISPITEALPIGEKEAAMSMLHSFYCWGSVLVIGVSSLFFKLFGMENWRIITLIWAMLPLSTLVIFLIVPIRTLPSSHSGFKGILSSKGFLIFLILMMCSGAGEIAMSQWASYFAEDALKVSKTVGDLMGPCLFAVFMGIGRVGYALFSDKINLKAYLKISSLGCVITYLVTAISPNPYLSLAGCAFTGLFVAIAWPGVLSLASQYNPKGGTGMFALLALAGDVGCTLGPQIVVLGASKINVLSSPIHSGLLLSALFPLVMIISISFLKAKNS